MLDKKTCTVNAIKTYEFDYWSIGFLWGSARFSGDYFLVQNIDKSLLEKLKKAIAIPNRIFKVKKHNGNITWRLKISKDHKYVQEIIKLGYTGRISNKNRDFPHLDKEKELDFFKGYFCTHFTLDAVRGRPRLRFYAAYKLLEKLNNHLHDELGTTVKKIADHANNDVCKILYYQSKKEVPVIIEYLDLI